MPYYCIRFIKLRAILLFMTTDYDVLAQLAATEAQVRPLSPKSIAGNYLDYLPELTIKKPYTLRVQEQPPNPLQLPAELYSKKNEYAMERGEGAGRKPAYQQLGYNLIHY